MCIYEDPLTSMHCYWIEALPYLLFVKGINSPVVYKGHEPHTLGHSSLSLCSFFMCHVLTIKNYVKDLITSSSQSFLLEHT